ncbi:MAG: hypothetical protein F6K30_26115 [Cyanothece sp. SIO2G6]|nr:hypothetical protein [Cyanothece sp. SIO2G6]
MKETKGLNGIYDFLGGYKFNLISPSSKFFLSLGLSMTITGKLLPSPFSLISLAIGVLILYSYDIWRPERVIHESALIGDLKKIKNCLKSGLDINIKDFSGVTALHYAAKGGQLEVGELLINNGADINLSMNSQGGPPLSWAILFKKNQFMELLISKGANINTSDEKQRSPLHLAAWSGNLYAVRYLVNHDSDINSRMFNNKTPLTLAKEKGYSDIINFLIQNSAIE